MALGRDTDWRATKDSIRERNQYLYNNKLLSDVKFSVKNSQGVSVILPAHKYVLAISSPVFEAMFYGVLADRSRTISLPDCTAEGLLELFRYMYYDEIELSLENIIEVIYLSKKYIIPPLTKRCVTYVERTVNRGDILGVLEELVVKMNDEELIDVCWGVIDKYTQRVVTGEAFLNVTQATLCDMLTRDSLEITEVELFQAVYRWAQSKITQAGLEEEGSSIRQVLGDELLHLIRFPMMSMAEFTELILPTEVLNIREVTEMVKYYNFNNNEAMVTIFSAKQRKGLPRKDRTLDRTNWYSKAEVVKCLKSSITFTTDTRLHIEGVRAGTKGNGTTCTIELQIFREEELMLQQKEALEVHSCAKMKLSKPFLIFPKTKYTMRANIEGDKMAYQQDYGRSWINCGGVGFNFDEWTSKDGDNDCDCDRAFPDIMLYYY